LPHQDWDVFWPTLQIGIIEVLKGQNSIGQTDVVAAYHGEEVIRITKSGLFDSGSG